MKQYTKDKIMDTVVRIFSSISIIVLTIIIGYIFTHGVSSLNIEMLKGDYWSKNELVEITNTGSYERPKQLEDDVYFIDKYGIGIRDSLSFEKDPVIEIVYIDEASEFLNATSLIKGEAYGTIAPVPLGAMVESFVINETVQGGLVYGHKASDVVMLLNDDVQTLELYYKTPGGGIRGSLVATIQLIGLSILIAFPIGCFAAIYLVEIAKKNRVTKILESLIELLAGVPSVIFGLMGMSVLYPVVAFFNVKGQSIILGALTMSVILLPIIIRSVQESLISVSEDLRSASLSLGATQTQTIFKVLLPSALPGILSALILSISRIVGESAALIFTMGTFVNDQPKLVQSATTLSVHIWGLMSHEQPNFEFASAIALIILILVLLLNISIRLIGNHFRKEKGI